MGRTTAIGNEQAAEKVPSSARLHLVAPAHTSNAVEQSSHYSLLQLWHLCSLDAPTVATLWTAFIAEAAHVHLPWTTPISMFLAVWLLYAADRILDARADSSHEQLEARHHFHYRHRRTFLAGLCVCSVVLSLLLRGFTANEMRLFSSVGALLIGYFFLIHMWSGSPTHPAQARVSRLPKEFAVGAFFSAAVFVPTVVRAPQLRTPLVPAACVFALLCTVNCLYVYVWEHSRDFAGTHWSTRFASKYLSFSTWCSIGLCAITIQSTGNLATRTIATACLTSMLCIVCLHYLRARFDALTTRACVDLALLVPMPVLAYVHLR